MPPSLGAGHVAVHAAPQMLGAPPSDPWYADPRWWGIIASAAIGIASLLLQLANRRGDRLRDEADAVFDAEVASPLRSSYPGVTSLVTRLRSASGQSNAVERRVLLDAIVEGTAVEAFDGLATAALVADTTCGRRRFALIAIELEDDFYPLVERMRAELSANELAAIARAARTALSGSLAEINTEINTAWRRYRRTHRRRPG